MGRIRLRWAVEFLSALTASDLAAFVLDLALMTLAGAVVPQAIYAAEQYFVAIDIVCSGFRSDCRGSRFAYMPETRYLPTYK